MDGLKRCTTCEEPKPATVDFFYAQAGCRDGLTPRCKECARIAGRRNFAKLDGATKARYSAASQQWMKDNPGWVRSYRKAKRVSDPETTRSRDARTRLSRADKRSEEFKRWYEANRTEKLDATRAWRKANPEKVRENYESWRQNNPKSYAATRRRAHQTFFSKPRNRLDRKVRAGLHKYLSGKGVSRSWEAHVGYTLGILYAHLERQFQPGMTWHNMGDWHLDHVLPLSSFSYESVADEEFRAAWSLANLRPIWAKENLQKGAKRLLLV